MNALKNALKYGLLLGLGLLALGLCTAPAAAQSASGLTKAVVPRHPQPLPDVGFAPPAQDAKPKAEKPQLDQPQRGMPTPRPIEIMMDEEQFDQAIVEFEKYMDTVQGDPCDLLYLPYTFYNRLLWEDASKTAFYQEKIDSCVKKFMQTCGHTVEGYMLREERDTSKIPDSTVVWMTKAIELDATLDLPYLVRGHALWELQRTQEACADYKRAADRKNQDAQEIYPKRCANQ